MNKLWIIFTFIAFNINAEALKENTWLNHLKKCIYEDFQPYEVMLLYNKKKKMIANAIDERLQAIGGNVPIRTLDYHDITESKLADLKQDVLFRDSRSTTMFIVLEASQKNSFIDELIVPMNFITRLSGSRIRPRCLILHLQKFEEVSYKEFFEMMWLEKFLDLSVLQLTQKGFNNPLLNAQIEAVNLHHFNPFTQKYTKEEFRSKIRLFPEKLRNLNGYPMMVGGIHSPPFISLKRNSTGHLSLSGMTGFNAPLTNTLSKSMNFTMQGSINKEGFGTIGCYKERNTGSMYELTHDMIDFHANQLATFSSCDLNIEQTVITGYVRYQALVPRLYEEQFSLKVSWNFIFAVLFIIAQMILVWVTSRLLRFSKGSWRAMYIVQMVLGSSTPRDPERLKERILFAALLFACIVYSSDIYTMLTDIRLTSKTEVEFHTLQDLDESQLVLLSTRTRMSQLKNLESKIVKRLMNKSQIMEPRDCEEMMVNHKNVSCTTTIEKAMIAINSYRDDNGGPVLKLVKQDLLFTWKTLPLKPNSPYVERFNEIILRLFGSGLMVKWGNCFTEFSNTASNELPVQTGEETASLRWSTIFILATGYLLSLIVFVVEVLVWHSNRLRLNRIRKRK